MSDEIRVKWNVPRAIRGARGGKNSTVRPQKCQLKKVNSSWRPVILPGNEDNPQPERLSLPQAIMQGQRHGIKQHKMANPPRRRIRPLHPNSRLLPLQRLRPQPQPHMHGHRLKKHLQNVRKSGQTQVQRIENSNSLNRINEMLTENTL